MSETHFDLDVYCEAGITWQEAENLRAAIQQLAKVEAVSIRAIPASVQKRAPLNRANQDRLMSIRR